MSFTNPPDEVIERILTQPRRVAVVGCSPDPARDSHRIALLLIAKGHDVVPVNPRLPEVLERRCYPDLLSIPGGVEMVDVFRRSDHVAALVEEAIAAGAAIFWTQLGVVDEEAALRARATGLTVVMDRCPAIEYRRFERPGT